MQRLSFEPLILYQQLQRDLAEQRVGRYPVGRPGHHADDLPLPPLELAEERPHQGTLAHALVAVDHHRTATLGALHVPEDVLEGLELQCPPEHGLGLGLYGGALHRALHPKHPRRQGRRAGIGERRDGRPGLTQLVGQQRHLAHPELVDSRLAYGVV